MQLVDANIVAYALVQGEMTERARALWSEDGDWRAPHLLFSELANIFTQLLRHQAVPLEDVEAGLDSAARMVRTLEH